MIRAGLDISMNSTAICVLKDNEYKWINFAPNITDKTRKFDEFAAIDNCNLITFNKNITPHNQQTLSQSIENKYKNFNNLYNQITSNLFDVHGGEFDSICVEGPSYNSRGRAQIDLVVCNHYIIFKLFEKGLKDITFIPPSNVKKLAGKGNFNKFQMLEAFKLNILKDEILEKSEFYKWVQQKKITTKSIPKPIDDMIDAYFILKHHPSQPNTDL